MKNKIIKIGAFIIIIALVVLGYNKLITYGIKTMKGSVSQVNAEPSEKGEIGKLIDGEENPGEYDYNVDTGEWEAFNQNEYHIPTYKDFQIYCINPGSPLRYKWTIRWSEAKSLPYTTDSISCLDSGLDIHPYEGDYTPPVYRVEPPIRELPHAAAYIVSDVPLKKWSPEKQLSIWHLKNQSIYDKEDIDEDEEEDIDGDDEGFIIGDGNSLNDNGKATIYDEEAKNYASYDSSVRGEGLKPEDKTSLNDVYTKVNQTRKEYTVGPFNMNYTNGIYETTNYKYENGEYVAIEDNNNTIAFSGISEMVVIGYNSKKEQVRDNIKIEKFILKDITTENYGAAEEPQYFEPSEELKVDETKQVYPVSGQDFQIVFKDPNEGVENENDKVAYISIKVKFKYMLANGKYAKLKGVKYTVLVDHDNTYNPHHHCDSGCGVDEETGKEYHSGDNCNGCLGTYGLKTTPQQYLMAADAIRSVYEQEIEIASNGLYINTTMDLGGHVWEDTAVTKESKTDGVSNTEGDIDKPLKNVKVTLYTYDSKKKESKIAKLLSNPEEEEIMHRINPTYTDEDGNYLFEGLDPMQKYYVRFEYNGQIYLPAEYLNTEKKQYDTVTQMVNAGLYNTDEWKVTSKGTEDEDERDDYDAQFKEIGSYPENYQISNETDQSINSTYFGKKYSNATFTQLELMGYTLNRDGKYKQTEDQLIDGYLYDKDGLQTTEYSQGIVTDKVREYIKRNKKFPSTNEMKEIYKDIAGNDEELWKKLQFIEDCKIESYTQGQDKPRDLYPVYDTFKINHAIDNKKYETAAEVQNGKHNPDENNNPQSQTLDGVTYYPIYPGQFFVNQGLWRRQEFDAALRKDVYKATLKINGKTEVYNYDKRSDEDKYWDINVRMSDYDNYYNTGYNREVYKADYYYNSEALKHPGADLEIYVTYKITIRNQSQSIMTQIKEVVDYYDEDYIYRDDLSWVTYKEGEKNNTVTDKEYYDAMAIAPSNYSDEMKQKLAKYITNARKTQVNKNTKKNTDESKYGSSTHSDITNTYQAVYINGLKDKKLATGESAYIYLTFQVNKDKDGKVILDEERNNNDATPKQNIAEINGYATYYYKDDTKLPNGISKTSEDIAGLLDRDSNPGNLTQRDITNKDEEDKYEKNFEDDTDRAKSLRILIDKDAIRKINGTVWEDQRNSPVGDAMIGNGTLDNGETKVNGVTVQLVEKTIKGKEYIWQETTTNWEGDYSFENYIPGDYVIRFYYGNTEETTKIKGNEDYSVGGLNDVSYNGQDFKSTTYQKGITDIETDKYTDESNRYKTYTDTTKQNKSGTYGYDIYQADAYSKRVSDAKDLYDTQSMLTVIEKSIKRTSEQVTESPKTTVIDETASIHGRTAVMNYSKQNITNHIAEVLASPYETPTYNDKKYDQDAMNELINELMQKTYMTAETGVIAVEFEYDRQQSDGLKNTENNETNSSKNYKAESNRYNGKYELKNIDFGLVERPKAQLEIDKSISNIKVTLANNSAPIDVNKAGDNVIWKDHTEYGLNQKAAETLLGGYKTLEENKKIYENYYGTASKNRYSYREIVNDIVKGTDKGLIQLTMDEELMHGATIEITYKVKVTNVGEVDYEGQKFYYLGDSTGANQVTTTANQVIDYVANNLQFYEDNVINKGWTVANREDLMKELTDQEKETLTKEEKEKSIKGLVNTKLGTSLSKFNNIIVTLGLNEKLEPGHSTEKTLILTQLITPENKSDDLTYNNIVEIVKTSNTVGRRMAYSVVGNQDPRAEAAEVDSSRAERVIILPPFGERHIYYILAATIAIILIGGITLIIKKVLRK